jgi:tetratricopeptide (TPR) repeat protein
MNRHLTTLLALQFALAATVSAQHEHASHPAPEVLGAVIFPTTCEKSVQPAFERALALLHSFAYTDAEAGFRAVATADPKCAIAHWGVAMSLFHQLWDNPGPQDLAKGAAELAQARTLDTGSPRERAFIAAAAVYFTDDGKSPHAVRAKAYEQAMAEVATRFPDDAEAQIFHALALIAIAPPTDRTHAYQKRAADILEPLYHRYPQHPGLAHYLIHAYDSAELAPRGLAAARAYAKIAPSAPHALHMPSHVFTRLGDWNDSIASNKAARAAARATGDVGEELHAMDYLTYAYLQLGRDADAKRVVDDAASLHGLAAGKFKIGYAANAMPTRYAIERRQWKDATTLQPLPDSEPHVAAIVYWARAVGASRSAHPDDADADIARIDACIAKLDAAGNTYWATLTRVLADSARAWQFHARGNDDEAIALLRKAADSEDASEKLPVTPGPIVPAREQLGDLLLETGHPADALREFRTALKDAPGRRGALNGAAQASRSSGQAKAAKTIRPCGDCGAPGIGADAR